MNDKQFDELCNTHYLDNFFKKHTGRSYAWEEPAGKELVKMFNIKSVLDLGCCVGRWMKGIKEYGCSDVLGLEYCYDRAKPYIYECVFDNIKKGDVSLPLNLKRTFDCVLSIEVAEHINPNNSEHFVKNCIKHSNNIIVLTAAPPGQKGVCHINCREQKFWINLFEQNGSFYDVEKTSTLKNTWSDICLPYITKNLMVFSIKEN